MIRTFLALVAIGFVGQVSATDRSYTFVEFTYSHYENDTRSFDRADAAAKGLRGSFALGNSGAYLLGAYRDFEYDGFVLDTQPLIASRLVEVGAGYGYQLHPSADIVLELAQQRSSYESRRFDYVDFREVTDKLLSDSQRLSIGTRASFNEHVEATVKFSHFRNDRCDCSPSSYSLGLVAKVQRHLALTVEFERFLDHSLPGVFGGPGATLSAGLRASF